MTRLFWIAFILFVLWKLTVGSDSVELGPSIKLSAAPAQETIIDPQPFDFKSCLVESGQYLFTLYK